MRACMFIICCIFSCLSLMAYPSLLSNANRFGQMLFTRNLDSSTLLGEAKGTGVPIERFYRFDKIIIEAAGHYQIDPLFIKAILIIESKLDPAAVSKSNARGIAQFMRNTAKALGITNCHDPRTSIWGCAAFIRRLCDHFHGNMILITAAYNAGPGAIKRAGWKVPRMHETRSYVPSVLWAWERMHVYHKNNTSGLSV